MYLDLLSSDNDIIDIPNYFNNEERLSIFKDQNFFKNRNNKKS